MERELFLSVIMPVYNAEKYLPCCLDSLLVSGVEDMEVILVDDGSTDRSGELCREYQQRFPRIRYIRQQNSGPSAARNNGLSHAVGEYIAFLDSDDYIDSAAFSRHIGYLRGSGADIQVSDFRRVADNGCVLDEVYQIRDTERPICDRAYFPEFLSARDCVWNVWRYIFRREFLEENTLRFAEGYSIAEDLKFVVQAFGCRPSMSFFHEPYYFYRVNYSATLTRQFGADKVRQLVTMLQSAMETLGETEPELLLQAKLAREYILNLSTLYEMAPQERKAAQAEFEKGLWLMEPAAGAYKCAAQAVKLLGIPVAARLLYMMKRMKRLRRGVKTKFFDRG